MSARKWVLNGVMALDTPLWIVSIPGEQVRIEIADYSSESEHIAHLIAAAPELLDALRFLVDRAARHESGCPASRNSKKKCVCGIGPARTAIAMAEGAQ